MLVLSRKQQEQIKIGDQITVTIVRVKGNTVRVGIEAPRDVRVIRGELPKVNDEAAVSSVTVAGVADASGERLEPVESLPSGSIVSFRVRCECGDEAGEEAAVTSVSASSASVETPAPRLAHLPLKRLHDRYGDAPLKQLLAASATLAK
jgi:carbon storage regulator CsrA